MQTLPNLPTIVSLTRDIAVLSQEVTSTLRRQIPLKVFADVLATMPTAVVICEANPQKTIYFVNDAFLNTTGYTKEEVIGESCSLFNDLHMRPIMDNDGQTYAFMGTLNS